MRDKLVELGAMEWPGDDESKAGLIALFATLNRSR
jgi:hypothetical protein